MKICGTCRKTYGDEMLFCLDDGSMLRDDVTESPGEAQTVLKPAGNDGNSKAVIFAISGFMLITFLLITLGAGGLIYYSTRPETATTNSNAEETPAQDPTPESMDQYYATPLREPTTAQTSDKPVKEAPPKTPTPKTAETDEPETPPQRPTQISGGIVNGKATSLPQPVYPPAARAVRASGQVIVQVIIDTSGNVVSARALRGHPLLRPAAVRAARQAKFSPTLLAGEPVTVKGMVRYNFEP